MDLGIIAAVIMLVVWAVLTFTTEAPGYVHLLLTIGFFVLFWRVAARGSGKPRGKPRKG
jgi:membrane protein implicated in regulation of membrane protease activity